MVDAELQKQYLMLMDDFFHHSNFPFRPYYEENWISGSGYAPFCVIF